MTVALIKHDASAVIEYRDDSAMNIDQDKLAPNKPYLVPVVQENTAFDPNTQVQEGPATIVETERVVWRYTNRAKTTQEVEQMRTGLLLQLREQEFVRISEVMTQGEHLAMTTGGFSGMLTYGLDRNTWPAGLRNQFNALFDVANTKCRDIHLVFNTKKAEIMALTTPQQMSAYDVTTGWPQ
jgi:hypothetical protein